MKFTPGELTAAQARELNEKLRVVEQFSRLTVAAPLSLTRPAGIPAIRLDQTNLGEDIFLCEVTSHTGTPPVHTVKRKTRDTSNNVIDLTPAVIYTQVLNPLEEILPNGTLVAIFPIPEFEDWWWAIPIDSGTPPEGDCDTCGWLLDRDALITAKKTFRVKIHSGLGRCTCMSDQGLDDDDVWLALYDSGLDKWVMTRTLSTCCACTKLTLDLTPASTIPATAQIVGKIACDDSGTYTYDLKFQCCSPTKAWFAGAGPKLCDTPEPFPCDNSFLISIECADCDLENVSCSDCDEGSGPPVFHIATTTFSGVDVVYNGDWYLVPDPDNECTWTVTCGTVTVTLVVTDMGAVITFTGGGGGGATYTASVTPPDQIVCFATISSSRTSGDTDTTPASVSADPKFCELATPCCSSGGAPDTLYITFSNASAGLECINALTIAMPYTGDVALGWDSMGVGDHPCTSGSQIAVAKCVDGEWNVSYGAPGGCSSSAVVAPSDCSGDTVTFGTLTFVDVTSGCGSGDGSGTVDFVITKTPP